MSLNPNLVDLKISLMDSVNPKYLVVEEHSEHSAGVIWGFFLYKTMHRQLELRSSLYGKFGTMFMDLAGLVDLGRFCSKSSPCGCVSC